MNIKSIIILMGVLASACSVIPNRTLTPAEVSEYEEGCTSSFVHDNQGMTITSPLAFGMKCKGGARYGLPISSYYWGVYQLQNEEVEEGKKLIKSSAEQGFEPAQYKLYYMYCKGQNVEKNDAESQKIARLYNLKTTVLSEEEKLKLNELKNAIESSNFRKAGDIIYGNPGILGQPFPSGLGRDMLDMIVKDERTLNIVIKRLKSSESGC